MPTLKSIVSADLPTDKTTIYTNATAGNSVLKALNISHSALPSDVFASTTTSDNWSALGWVQNFAQQSGFCKAFSIQMSDDRLLLLMPFIYRTFTKDGDIGAPSNLHCHAQIVEFQSGKYVCGPITQLILPATLDGFLGYSRQASGVAVTSSMAVVFSTLSGPAQLFTITTTGNTVDSTVRSLNVSTIFANNANTALVTVPGDATKVVAFGRGTTNYLAAAFTVSTSANPVQAGTTFDTGIAYAASSPSMDCALHRRSDPTYMFACFSTATTVTARIFTFTSATNTFAAASASTTVPLANAASSQGIAVCALSAGTAYSSVIATANTTNARYEFAFQTNAATIGAAITTRAAGGSQTQYIQQSYNVGLQKAIIFGDCQPVGVIDGGVTQDVSANIWSTVGTPSMVYPFKSRPLLNYNTYGSLAVSNIGRVGLTETSFGAYSGTGNYFPHGLPSGRHYMYSETAGAYIIGQGARLYLVDTAGVVLAERALPVVSTESTSVKSVTVSPKGFVAVALDCAGTYTGSGYIPIQSSTLAPPTYIKSFSTSVAVTVDNFATVTFTEATSHNSSRVCDMISWTGNDGVDRYQLLTISDDSVRLILCWQQAFFGNTTGLGASGSHYVGTDLTWYGMDQTPAIVQVSPPSSTNVNGLFVVAGCYGANAQASVVTVLTTPEAGISGAMSTIRTTLVASGSRPITCPTVVSRSQSGLSVVASGSGISGTAGYVWISNKGNMSTNYLTGNPVTLSGLSTYPRVAASRNLVQIAWLTQDGTSVAPIIQNWIASSTAPVSSVSGAANAVRITPQPTGIYSINLIREGMNYKADFYGVTATSVNLILNNGTADFSLTPLSGSTIQPGDSSRSTSVYYLPPGYSIKAFASVNKQVDLLLTVLEEA